VRLVLVTMQGMGGVAMMASTALLGTLFFPTVAQTASEGMADPSASGVATTDLAVCFAPLCTRICQCCGLQNTA